MLGREQGERTCVCVCVLFFGFWKRAWAGLNSATFLVNLNPSFFKQEVQLLGNSILNEPPKLLVTELCV